MTNDAIEFGLDTPVFVTVDESGQPLSGDVVIRNTIEEAVLADAVGIDSFNIGEHYRARPHGLRRRSPTKRGLPPPTRCTRTLRSSAGSRSRSPRRSRSSSTPLSPQRTTDESPCRCLRPTAPLAHRRARPAHPSRTVASTPTVKRRASLSPPTDKSPTSHATCRLQ